MKAIVHLERDQLALLIDVIRNRVEGGDVAFEAVVVKLELALNACDRLGARMDRWRRSDTVSRPLGCRCHQEVGDSPCPVHPSEDEAMLQRALGAGPVPPEVILCSCCSRIKHENETGWSPHIYCPSCSPACAGQERRS